MTEQAATQSASGGRPTLITILCVLSFIGGGLGILGGLAASLLTGLAGSLSSIPGMGAAMAGGFTYGIITLVLSAVSLFGAIKIWGMKKMGVFLYAGAQVLMLITPWVFMSEFQSVAGAAFGWVITAAFIAGYWSQMKNMS